MRTLPLLLALSLTGCASMFPPSVEKLASLPVVEFPNQPPVGDFIFKLPAGKPIPTRVAIEGNLSPPGRNRRSPPPWPETSTFTNAG